MNDIPEPIEFVFVSDYREPFLLAELRAGDVPVCQVLKRQEAGQVLLSFFKPETREEVLVDPERFVAVLREAVEEIRNVRES